MSHGNHNTSSEWNAHRETRSAYADEALAPDERVLFEGHLSTCAECQRELAEYRSMRALLRGLPQPALPRSFVLPPETPVVAAPDWRHRAPQLSPSRPIVPFRHRAGRIAQRVGVLAAVIGLALVLGSVLPQLIGSSAGTSTASYGAAAGRLSTAATTPARSASAGSDQAQLSPEAHVGAPSSASSPSQPPAEVQPSPTPQPSMVTSSPGQTEREPPSVQRAGSLTLPLAGTGLLLAGAALLAVGTVASRRRSPPPAV